MTETYVVDADRPETTDDAFLGGRLMVLQPRSGYRAGIDAVFLAAATPVFRGAGARVLDCGSGVGTAGLCLAFRVDDARVVLIEREPALAALAVENCRRNKLDDRASVICGDATGKVAALQASGLAADSFDHAIANPPYHSESHGTPSAEPLKSSAHAMPVGGLEAWVRCLARLVRPGGTATIVHKAAALTDIISLLDGRFGGVKILGLHPRAGSPANRILVQGTKGSRAPITLLPGLVLHSDANGFTDAAKSVLSKGAGLTM